MSSMRLLPVGAAALLLTLALTAGAVRDSLADPAGDESVVVFPSGAESQDLCSDPSIDVLSVAGSGDKGAISVSLHYAGEVLSEQLTCGGVPAPVEGKRYFAVVGRHEDGNLLLLDVTEGRACVYVYFTAPYAVSDCVGEVRVDGTEIRFEAPTSGDAPMFDGTSRPYALVSPAHVGAVAYEYSRVEVAFQTVVLVYISDVVDGLDVPLEE